MGEQDKNQKKKGRECNMLYKECDKKMFEESCTEQDKKKVESSQSRKNASLEE